MQTPRSSSRSSKTDPRDPRAPIHIGTVTKAHGIRGAFVIGLDATMKDVVTPGSVLQIGATGRTFNIAKVSTHGPGLLVTAEEITDRNEAETLRGLDVAISRDQLPPLEEGSFYDFELIGAEVLTDQGRRVGVLQEILQTGANDVYVVRSDDGEVLIAAAVGTVHSIDAEAGRIVIDARAIAEDDTP